MTGFGSYIKSVLGSWFKLTPTEQKAVVLILTLFLVGLLVKFWHVLTR